MARLPDEIWTEILDYLEPDDIISTQRVSSRLLKVARDPRLWRFKCYERAPSAANYLSGRPNALSTLTGALGGLSLDGPIVPPVHDAQNSSQHTLLSKRSKAVAEWDCTDTNEHINWYSDYIGRHAPLSVEWAKCKSNDPEVLGMALFNNGESVISPLADGSLRIWNVERPGNQRPKLKYHATSKPGILYEHLIKSQESSDFEEWSLGHAVDNVVVDHHSKRAYVAAGSFVNEIDLATMSLVSQHKHAWPVTAISQNDENGDFNLTIGTSWSLHIHDSRLRLRSLPSSSDVTTKIDGDKVDSNIAFFPNYTKKGRCANNISMTEELEKLESLKGNARGNIQTYARVEPGLQTILHRGPNEIITAGRMPSILFYDRRFFPYLKSSIYSGASLSSMTTLPFTPTNCNDLPNNQHTLFACGDYKGRGSLEIYGLPAETGHNRVGETGPLSSTDQSPYVQSSDSPVLGVGYQYCNRQSASSSKLLSVCVQGARIVVSDADGHLRWFERDGRGLARRWNINAASYNFTLPTNPRIGSTFSQLPISAGITSHADVVRKMVSMPDSRAEEDLQHGKITYGDNDILVWTGEKVGIVTCRTQWDTSYSHEDLVQAFESKMNLDGGSGSDDDEQTKEAEYARQMRRALERQADERRWMSRFGGRWR